MSIYGVLLQAIVDSPKSAYMGGGQSKWFIGRQKYISDQQKTKQKATRRNKSARLLDRMGALVHSPDFKLLTKRQRNELTELCAQTMSPDGSEVSKLQPKVLSEMFVESQEGKPDSDSDSDSNSDAKRSQFNARETTLFAEVAAQASITQVGFNEWLDQRLVTQQVVASSPIVYNEELHEALNGGGLRSMSDSEYDTILWRLLDYPPYLTRI